MRYLLLVDTCFVLSPLVEGAACTINTFHACGLRSVGKELDGLDWIDIYVENAGSFFLVAIYYYTTSYSVEYIQTQKSLKFTYDYCSHFSSHGFSKSIITPCPHHHLHSIHTSIHPSFSLRPSKSAKYPNTPKPNHHQKPQKQIRHNHHHPKPTQLPHHRPLSRLCLRP
jgi:hypothetical protein